VLIRDEVARDHAAVRHVVASAFETAAESRLVDALRERARPVVSLVAEKAGSVVGHVMFSPVSLSGHPEVPMMGLAPMAVAPEHQRTGIGSALARAGLDRCAQLGIAAVVVLGHPAYYPRFGFVPASRFEIDCEYADTEEAFMAIELIDGALRTASGRIHYHAAFADL